MGNPEKIFDQQFSVSGESPETASIEERVEVFISAAKEAEPGEFNPDLAFKQLSSDLNIDSNGSPIEIALEAHDRLKGHEKESFFSKLSSGKIARTLRTFILLAGLANFAGGRALAPSQLENPEEKEKIEQVVDWDWVQVSDIFKDIVQTKVEYVQQKNPSESIPATEIDNVLKQLTTLARAFKDQNRSVDEFHQAALNLSMNG